MTSRGVRWGALLLVGAVTALALAACTPPPVALPDGVTVAFTQPRTEQATGRLAFEVTNDSTQHITITRAELISPEYSTPIVWHRHDARIGPGYGIALRVDPVDPSCRPAGATADETASEPDTVSLDFRLDDGSTGTATVTPTDPFDQFPKIPDQICVGLGLAAVAPIASARIESDGQLGSPGRLVLSVTPATGEPTVDNAALHVIRSTILVSLLGSDGFPTAELPTELDLLALDGPTELAFPIIPARCDTHAVAEDRVGTLFPIGVTVGDRSDIIRLPSTAEFKGEVYAFVQAYCGI